MQMTLSSLQTLWKNASEGCYLEGGYVEEKDECTEDQYHDLRYRTEPIAELGRVPMCHLLHWSRQKLYSVQWLQTLGSQEMRLKEDPNYRCYRCLGTTRPIDGRPKK